MRRTLPVLAVLCLLPLAPALAQEPAPAPNDRDEHRPPQTQPQRQEQRPQEQPQQQDQHPQEQHRGGTPGANAPVGGTPQVQQQRPGGAAPQVQRPVQNTTPPSQNVAPQNASPQVQQQRFNGNAQGQRSGNGAPAATPIQNVPQQQQNNAPRGNFQGNAQPQARGNNNDGGRPANFQRNPAVFAQRHGGAAPTQFNSGRFYGHDFAHFTSHDLDLWHRGAWHHEFYDGRYGWWYDVDGIWYFYDQPVYPYPTYIPDVVYIPDEDYYDSDDGYADAPPLPTQVAPQPQTYQAQPYSYYYCDSSQAYYPYVSSCASPWRQVPAGPQ
jgi:hypothetical protein